MDLENFRLVYDRDTGKPKGYGFCEFAGMTSFAPSESHEYGSF